MTPLRQETRKLRARYDEEPGHSDQVAHLALELYDGLLFWHQLDERSRELLHTAALLHDIGWSQTPEGKGHHKHSARLIREHPWKGLEAEEVEMTAQVARYHRKTKPLPSHETFQTLRTSAKRQVMILGGILRLADALDRTHSGRIQRIEVAITVEALMIRVEPRGKWGAELAMFETKRDMLEEVAQREVRCEAVESGPLN